MVRTEAPVVLRFGAFGDTVLLGPLLQVLGGRYSQSCDLISSGLWTPALSQALGSVHELHLLDSRRAPYWFNRSQRRLVSWLRARPRGPVYIGDDDDKSHWLVMKGRVPPEWICSLRECPPSPGEHIVDHYHRLACATPAALASHLPRPGPAMAPALRLNPGEAARRDCEVWLGGRGLTGGPLVLIQPGNKRTMRRGARTRRSNPKYWPEQAWAEVAREVCHSLPEARVLVCGSQQEAALAQEIQALCGGGRVISVAGELPIPRLLALLARAHSMISVDTGPAHAAAAMGCPLAVLFAHRDPAYYAPLPSGGAVHRLLPEPGYEADDFPMLSITPSRVLEQWRALGGRTQVLRT